MTHRVLILDGQTTQALACARSLGRAGHSVLVASRHARPLALWSRWTCGHYRLVEETPASYARMPVWAVERGVTTVLPVTERSCLLCSADRSAWERVGITVGCGEHAVLMRAFDKAQTLEAARACGVAIPPSWMPTSQLELRSIADEVAFPCVVKSRFSDAWIAGRFVRGGGAAYVSQRADLLRVVQAHRQGDYWPIVQQFVGGTGKGVSGLCDRGRVVALFAHERLRDVRPSGSGSSLRQSIPLSPRLREPAERLVTELRWHGPVMVEFRDGRGEAPYLMEVNGRLWGSVHLAVAAGVDVPLWWLAVLHQERIEPMTRYTEGLTLRWLWGDIKRLLKILEGPPTGFPEAYPTLLQGLKEVLGPQPPGTRNETWDPQDPWPAVGEWIQGVSELVEFGRQSLGRKRKGVPERLPGEPRVQKSA